ncbi:amidase [Nostoc flagelliforme FACHB-838]|uniref:Amidase n=1 Tax=Nostoc flagelliforme FACHB-838 TaxID=2692904 RepID=A0ABR8E3A7_9NOSO|nr:amidase [Nostoc flagelliforme]MBD2536044.1 amidase [Nostoc flagelliforme FACHB-838]
MTNLTFTPAHQLAQMIRDRQVSAVEVLNAYLNQVTQHNSTINAICTLDEENACARAKQADEALNRGENWGALHGVPITVKDLLETAGLRTTAGSKSLKNYTPQQDATAVSRLRSAGAILLGKTNVGDLAGGYQGLNDVFLRVNNPWRLERTPGGTSSGSAAAIAAGLSPLDLCSDFGGSIRQPAHFCGIYGFKPTDRRIPTTGHIPEAPGKPRCMRQMLTIGGLARSIQDLVICFQIIAGTDAAQSDIPPVPLDQPAEQLLQTRRIAWIDEWSLYPVAAEIKSAMQSVATKLIEAGMTLEKWTPNFNFPLAWQTYYKLAAYNLIHAQSLTASDVRKHLAFLFRDSIQGDRAFRKLGNLASIGLPISLNPTLKGYFETLTERDRLMAQMDRELAQWDAWLCPVAMTTAFLHCARGAAIQVDNCSVPYSMASGAYVVPFNVTGHPAVVIPIGQTQNGLPIGMQIVGQRWREMELFAIAQELDKVVGNFRNPLGY